MSERYAIPNFAQPKSGVGIPPVEHPGGGYQLCALKASIAYNVASPFTVTMGTLPMGAIPLLAYVRVTTAFNAGTTNVLTIGGDAEFDDYVATADVNEAATGLTTVVLSQTALTADTVIKMKYAQTGTAASAGAATGVVLYLI